MERLPRIPRWLSVTVASISAALLVVGSAISDGLSGWWLVGWLVLAGGFAAAAIGLPQLQRWQSERDARLRVELSFEPSDPVVAVFDEGAVPVIDAWLESAKERCLASLRREQSPARDVTVDPPSDPGDDPLRGLSIHDLRRLAEKEASGEQLTVDEARALHEFRRTSRHLIASVGQGLSSLVNQAMTLPDDRTPEQYRNQVDKYLEACERRMLAHLVWQYAEEGLGTLRTVLRNPSERVYENVQVEIYLPGQVRVLDPERLPEPVSGMPDPPRPFGARKPLPDYGLPIPRFTVPPLPSTDIHYGGPEIDNSASANIRFDPVTLRPHARVELDTLTLIVNEPLGSNVSGTWSATATNVPGRTQGALRVQVANEPVDAAALLGGLLGHG